MWFSPRRACRFLEGIVEMPKRFMHDTMSENGDCTKRSERSGLPDPSGDGTVPAFAAFALVGRNSGVEAEA